MWFFVGASLPAAYEPCEQKVDEDDEAVGKRLTAGHDKYCKATDILGGSPGEGCE